jgi:arylsulfatase A-like enzyme
MGYQTPNIDRIAAEGMRFTDSNGEQSCTAGRSSFITGPTATPAVSRSTHAEAPSETAWIPPNRSSPSRADTGMSHIGFRCVI